MFGLILAFTIGAVPSGGPSEANLSFQGPHDLTVQCVSGCPDKGKVYLPDHFPALHVDAAGSKVRLRFRADGYRSATGDYKLRPGANRIVVALEEIAQAPR
jgi:hypothetical protein